MHLSSAFDAKSCEAAFATMWIMAKRKKPMPIKSLWTSDEKEEYEQGLRTLARLIARAYLCDMGIRSRNKALSKERQKP